MDPEPAQHILAFLPLSSFLMTIWAISGTVLCLLLLLCCSALISGSEVAFFSLSPNDLESLEKDDNKSNKKVLKLRRKPRHLLATILITNNFVNIGIVILSDYLIRSFLGDEVLKQLGEALGQIIPGEAMTLGRIANFLITVVGVTFLLVLFGEVAPKIYANINNLYFAKMMARPMSFLSGFFRPVSSLLVGWSAWMESKFIASRTGIDDTSKEELDKAIELTVSGGEESEEADILRGIIKFGNVSAKQVMKARVDVIAAEEKEGFKAIMSMIKDNGFSRIPIYREDFDEIIGILYAKDLLGFSQEDNTYNWQQHIRENVVYVPESKKIDDILKEFQKKRMHMAIVVDEFGGSAGIITLEDIVEEVIGEIKDEFDDEEEVDYVKINDRNYIFEGKTLLNDVARLINVDKEAFDAYRHESDSLAGLLLNHFGRIPKKDKEIVIGQYKFKIVAVTKRRIERVHVTLL